MSQTPINLKMIIGVMLLSLWAGWAGAQELSISASVSPQQGAVGQQLRLVVKIEGKANVRGEPQLPSLPDFRVYGGGRSSNFSFINGQVSSSLSFTYVLVPQKAGQFTVGPIKIEQGHKVYSTAPITLNISGGHAQAAPPANLAQPGQVAPQRSAPPRGSTRETRTEPLFITTSVDRKKVYVNQAVTLSFKFFRRVPILNQPQYQPPVTNGFWSEDLPPQKTYVVHIKGYDYEVTEIRTALFPTTTGELTISPATVVAAVQSSSQPGNDPFGDSFGDSFFSGFFNRAQQVQLKSKPITVTVEPIPAKGRPRDFTGTVGQWSMSAKLDRKQAKVGDAVTLEVRIFGEGNIMAVGKPQLPALTGFKTYETVSSSEVQKQQGKVKGVKIYRTLLRPQVSGNLTIPEISYSYFNPALKKFERITVPSLNLEVAPGDQKALLSQTTGALAGSEAAGPGVKVISKDIRYLKTDFKLIKRNRAPLLAMWMVGFGLPPLVLLGLWAWRGRQLRLASDPRYARKLAADKSARRVFKQAQQAWHKKDPKGFYTHLPAALTGYLADQLGYSRGGITQRDLLQQLKNRQVSSAITDNLAALLDECDYARFAPGQGDTLEMERHLKQAQQLLHSLMKALSQEKKA